MRYYSSSKSRIIKYILFEKKAKDLKQDKFSYYLNFLIFNKRYARTMFFSTSMKEQVKVTHFM